MLNNIEKEILLYVSKNGLSATERPFIDVANAVELKENEVIDILHGLKQRNMISELRGVIDHRKAGYNENALIAWQVEDDRIDEIKDVFINNDMISHCYQRDADPEFNYNLYTMIHSNNIDEVMDFVEKVASQFSLKYEYLLTEEELKRKKMDLESVLKV